MKYFERSFVEGGPDIKKFLELASNAGIDTIELMWNDLRKQSAQIIGVEYPSVYVRKNEKRSGRVDFNVSWIDGDIRFYPDQNDRCYGYLADTENNRIFLAKMIMHDKFMVVDPSIRKEIEALAKEKGYQTTVVDVVDEGSYKYVKKDREKDRYEEQIRKLEQQLAITTESLKEIMSVKSAEKSSEKLQSDEKCINPDDVVEDVDGEEVVVKKPLAGVRLRKKV